MAIISTSVPPVAPSLGLAPGAYDPQYIDQLSNQIRLYMARVGSSINDLTANSGGGGGGGGGGASDVLVWLNAGCN